MTQVGKRARTSIFARSHTDRLTSSPKDLEQDYEYDRGHSLKNYLMNVDRKTGGNIQKHDMEKAQDVSDAVPRRPGQYFGDSAEDAVRETHKFDEREKN